MNFRLATTFRESLGKLTGQEQKTVKTTVLDLQLDPAHPALKFHRIDKAKDPNFWSIRASGDIRVIVHKTKADFLVCYVDHHDKAYHWAERRRVENHPKTGATQIVEIRERVEEIPVFKQVEVEVEVPKLRPLEHKTVDELLSFGVPEDWCETAIQADEGELLEIAERLPAEAAEALLDLADGKTPKVATTVDTAEGFEHPDAQRRFHLFTDEEELALALEYPWEQWTVFLHPSQRKFAEQVYSGPARVAGSAGTGKTVVAMHRAVALAKRYSGAKVLLTTFSTALADLLQIKMARLVGETSDLAKRIEVRSLPDLCCTLYAQEFGKFVAAEDEEVREIIAEVLTQSGAGFSPSFVWSEWKFVLDAWQVESVDAYREVPRVGRRTRLGSQQREVMWEMGQAMRKQLEEREHITWATAFRRLTEAFTKSGDRPYDFLIVDEAQDLGVAELKFLATIGDRHAESLFFAGDGGQRIFQQPVSWKALGVDIRGRSNRLRINYRTSHQIRSRADILLPEESTDPDGNVTDRTGTISVFNGVPPELICCDDRDAEIETVAKTLVEWLGGEFSPEEVGIFVRSEAQFPRLRAALKLAGVDWAELERTSLAPEGKVAVSTMHLAKGLEFRGVIVMACDHDVVPLENRIVEASDEGDLEEIYSTERHLLYVAATRAREQLLITGVDPVSEFVEDMGLPDRQ